MHDKPKIGEILVLAGVIDDMQLKAALGEQARWGRRLGVTLIKMGMVEEADLIRALAKQLDLPVASLAGKKIPPEVIALVPGRVATEHCVMPLFTSDRGPNGQLFLGMEDPSNLAVLDDLTFRTGKEICAVMVGPTELGEAIDRYYLGGNSQPVPAADPFHSSDSGDTLRESNLRNVSEEPEAEAETQRWDSDDSERALPLQVAPEPQSGPSPAQLELSEPASALSAELRTEIAEIAAETERTRLLARAVATLLVDKGVLTLEEVQQQIATLKAENA